MEALHPLALNGLLWLVRISWQVSVLIAFVLLVQRLFHGRMTPAWRHALWLLVAARLLLPASLESRLSVFNWLRVGEPAVTSRPMRAVTPVALTGPALQAISAASPSTAAAPPTPTPAVPPGIFPAHAKLVLEEAETKAAAQVGDERTRGKIILWLAALWLAGVLVLSARVLLESVRLQRIIAPKRLVTDSAVLELLEDCKQLMGVRVPVVLVQTEFISSPVLYGFLRPRLLLPAGLLKDFSRAELRFVFLHELAHVRRHDIALSWLMSALQVLHWFNPLVWIAFQRMKADRELACDALVLSRTQDSEQKAYGRTMLRLLESFVRPTRFPAMAGILEDPSQLATRIRCIAAFNRRTPSPAFALGAALVLALVALTDQRVAAAAHGAAGWPARFLMTRDGGETDMRAVLLRPLAGVDMEKALAQGRLCIAPAADSTNLLQDGYEPIGVVDGLGLDRWQPHSKRGALSARAAHSMVWTGRELLVWGGGAMDIFKQSGAAYNPDTDTWRFLSTNGAPSGRWHHAAQWTGKEMIIWGGRANFYAKDNFDDGARYDPETDT